MKGRLKMKEEPIRYADLPDLRDWKLSPILTIEQAALLWGGIDPFFHTFETIKTAPHAMPPRRDCTAGIFERHCFKNPYRA